ncbi:MAG TPA: hypothetical protein DCZ01_11430 [Elusimicrobia bacterium]|nr:MAG: hypothetical protein A2X37_07765 [Elusimicrobia bacterium GWA2_66_18]OGR69735.1 MAG: hypothetical protein A2X40_09930 [Elusimicrobia bacterium GWC2_65_9]HAZ09103.1 hypothetical protein [Elusimicrobiota bacterium]
MSPNVLLVLLLLTGPVSAESFQSWAARASREEREKNDTEAVRSWSNALSSWKEVDGKAARAKAFCARGLLREKTGEDAEAVKDYTACLETDQKNAKVFHKRGLLRLKAGKTALAIDDFYKAVAVDIRFGQAYADRARAYESQFEQGFAREDYQRACSLGIKPACAKALKRTFPKRSVKTPKPDASPSKPAASKTAETTASPAKSNPVYQPRFNDCLHVLDACSESGKTFSACISAAPTCEEKAIKGCCPAACLRLYEKSLNRGSSEASAYREAFSPGAHCAVRGLP